MLAKPARRGPARSAPADPLTTLLRRAAKATDVPAVQEWLLGLLECGDGEVVPTRRREPAPTPRTPRRRERETALAQERLRAAGI
jgi:hypothetical protein